MQHEDEKEGYPVLGDYDEETQLITRVKPEEEKGVTFDFNEFAIWVQEQVERAGDDTERLIQLVKTVEHISNIVYDTLLGPE